MRLIAERARSPPRSANWASATATISRSSSSEASPSRSRNATMCNNLAAAAFTDWSSALPRAGQGRRARGGTLICGHGASEVVEEDTGDVLRRRRQSLIGHDRHQQPLLAKQSDLHAAPLKRNARASAAELKLTRRPADETAFAIVDERSALCEGPAMR